MAQFLKLYLIVTGLLGGLVLAAPALVILGYFLLILPGLILGLTPAAFLWGAIFALVWWPARTILGDWIAIAPALAVTALIVVGVPRIINARTQAQIDALRSEDRDAAAPIALAGAIRIERTTWRSADNEDPEWAEIREAAQARRESIPWRERPAACDALCAAILFTPGVETVSVVPVLRPGATKPPGDRAAAYRLERAGSCADAITPTNAASASDGFPSDAKLAESWRLRASLGECVRRVPVPSHADLTISISDWREDEGKRPGRWSLRSTPDILRLELRDAAGATLLRRTQVRVAKLGPLFMPAPKGGMSDFAFGWDRHYPRQSDVPGHFTPVEILKAVAGLSLAVDVADLGGGSRERLAAILADPTVSADDPGFKLANFVLEDMGKGKARPGDAELAARIVADPRAPRLNSVWNAIRGLGADAATLREPMVRRILAATAQPRDEAATALGEALRALPEGLFATPTPDETRLLEDPVRREFAAGLIIRQADRGAEAVPLLTRIFVEDWRRVSLRDRRSASERRAGAAALRALCVLGPVAVDALPAIEELIASGAIPRAKLDHRDFHLALARLGRPISQFYAPPNQKMSDEAWRARLERRLDAFRPDRDCV